MVYTTVPREVSENMARAKAYLKRDEVIRSLDAAVLALNTYISVKIVGNAKYMAEVLFHEYANELSANWTIKQFFAARGLTKGPFVIYKSGREQQLSEGLTALKMAIEKVNNAARRQKEEQAHAERKNLLTKGLDLLYTQGDEAKGRAVLRRYIDHYGSEPGVIVEIANHFLKANLPIEAAELFERAMENFPKDPKGFTGAIQAYTAMGDRNKVENTYLLILRTFGAHPNTYLRMSKFYLEWNKKDKAYDYAARALDGDKSLKEAQLIMDKIDKRI
ncbi:MAG: hypothetical protein IJD04_06100 [Desulfovibrionaceae bacterium]|nr:hypothetical protein [Desulfovibrionaceae bacterium]